MITHWKATRPDGSPIPDDGISADRSIHLRTADGELDLVSEKTAAVGFEDLLVMKRAVGRERDLVDLADLEAAHGELPDNER